MCGDTGVRSNISFLMTMCLELISAHGQVYVTLERVTVLVVYLKKKKIQMRPTTCEMP